MTILQETRSKQILVMKATDDERVAAYKELLRQDYEELVRNYANTKLIAPDGTLHDLPPLPSLGL